MPIHVAIVVPPYDRLILEGRKTIECRLTKQPRPPFGAIAPGERIYFKRSAGPFFATAVADRTWMADMLTPAKIDRIRRRFNDRIHGAAEYWNTRRDARRVVLIWLREVRPTTLHPPYRPQNMRAWYTLDESADPLGLPDARPSGAESFKVVLTRGSLNQRSVRITGWVDRFPAESLGGRTKRERGETIALHLKGGPAVLTDIVAHQKMFRWRGWGPWFERCGLKPGDRLRFTLHRERVFLVEPVRVKSD